MALFKITQDKLTLCKPINFNLEKELQILVESNLETIFSCRFVATEFPTGSAHSGRIDTLAISEDGNPVILEYKKVESSQLLNQSLYYLNWILDHRGDFQVAANKAFNNEVEIDWNDIRVICLAPGYTKYDLHAAQVMGASIELWQYKLYDDGSFYIEEIFRRNSETNANSSTVSDNGKDPKMVAAGKKAAITRATGSYTVDEHLEKMSESSRLVAEQLREFILSIDNNIEEIPKKFYLAYKTTKNFVCLQTRKNKIHLYLKIHPSEISTLPENARDVSEIGHYGTGDFELTISNAIDAEAAEPFIRKSYENVGG